MDHQGLPPTDLYLFCAPEPAVDDLLRALRSTSADARALGSDGSLRQHADRAPAAQRTDHHRHGRAGAAARVARRRRVPAPPAARMGGRHVALSTSARLRGLGWRRRHRCGTGHHGRRRALRSRARQRLPVSIFGDGDYLMGVNALWTAATTGVPLLAVVCNNRSFFNDEVHQERVAKIRSRPVENRWIGQRIDEPAPDLGMLARGARARRHRSGRRRRHACRTRWTMRCGA